jgi:hypothetical protein
VQLRADYKLVAKALARIGSAYIKLDNYENGIKFYQKSLTEHRTADTLNKLRDAERAKAEGDRKAYLDPARVPRLARRATSSLRRATLLVQSSSTAKPLSGTRLTPVDGRTVRRHTRSLRQCLKLSRMLIKLSR